MALGRLGVLLLIVCLGQNARGNDSENTSLEKARLAHPELTRKVLLNNRPIRALTVLSEDDTDLFSLEIVLYEDRRVSLIAMDYLGVVDGQDAFLIYPVDKGMPFTIDKLRREEQHQEGIKNMTGSEGRAAALLRAVIQAIKYTPTSPIIKIKTPLMIEDCAALSEALLQSFTDEEKLVFRDSGLEASDLGLIPLPEDRGSGYLKWMQCIRKRYPLPFMTKCWQRAFRGT